MTVVDMARIHAINREHFRSLQEAALDGLFDRARIRAQVIQGMKRADASVSFNGHWFGKSWKHMEELGL